MSPIRIIILVIAAAAALGAAFLVQRMSTPDTVTKTVLQDQLVVETREVSEVKVLTANKDFAIGDTIAEADLVWAPWPKANLVEGYFTEAEMPDAITSVAGSVARAPIFQREPILPQRIVNKGDTSLMTALLRPGMRAVSVEISAESASGGFILPNDRVDLILTREIKGQGGQGDRTAATTIAQNIRVLAIDQTFKAAADEEEIRTTQIGNTATLELTPKEAELIAMAQLMGRISLTLRPLNESSEEGARGSRLDLLEGDSSGTGQGVMIVRNGRATISGAGGN